MNNGLSLFATTADQRFLLGRDIFLRTHYPMHLRCYRTNGEVTTLSEQALLQQVLDNFGAGPGNRLWILYGAPGSGKSELIKWLETRIVQESPQRAQITVRISRDELDILSIVKRFLHLLPDGFTSEAVNQRWQTARQKSRTVAKLILLFALESLLESDEIINALFYRLLNAVQPYVDHILEAEAGGNAGLSSVELMGRETWEAILRETSLEIPLEYEQFRHHLTVAFRDHLLEGISLPDTMRRIAEHCIQDHAQRPILLVDDLVQSLNIFATDILDYLLTLEAGHWDVIVGLTPAAFEENQRGRELLQRIAYLDTIDDRVEKLWLSDEAGLNSYILTEDNCYNFAARYLQEYQQSQETSGENSQAFFVNQEVLVRIFRNLPSGKGKARYFLRYLREILEQIEGGESVLNAVAPFAQPEYAVRCDNPTLAAIGELYGPLLATVNNHDQILLTADLLQAFGLPAQDVPLDIEPLRKLSLPSAITEQMVDDEEKTAIHDWLLERPVNRQLVKGVRRGAARWLRDVQATSQMYRDHIPKPYGVLRWQKKYLDTNPPIYLEDIDDAVDEGIMLPRAIGLLAFDLHRYATAKGNAVKALQEQLGNEPVLSSLLFAGATYRTRVMNRLQQQVGMPVDVLALALYVFRLALDGVPAQKLPGFPPDFWDWLQGVHSLYGWTRDSLDERAKVALERFFNDFFQLRQNLYDGGRIQQLLQQYPPNTLFEQLLAVDLSLLDRDYRLSGKPLKEVLAAIQAIIRRVQTNDRHGDLSTPTQQILEQLETTDSKGVLFSEIPLETWIELEQLRPHLFAALRVRLDLQATKAQIPREE